MVSSLRCGKDKVQDGFLIAALHIGGHIFYIERGFNYDF